MGRMEICWEFGSTKIRIFFRVDEQATGQSELQKVEQQICSLLTASVSITSLMYHEIRNSYWARARVGIAFEIIFSNFVLGVGEFTQIVRGCFSHYCIFVDVEKYIYGNRKNGERSCVN